MRILYMTSVCDPDHTISASAFSWARALSARSERVDVIALDARGETPPNMHLHSLKRSSRPSRVSMLPDLARALARTTRNADVIFCQYSTTWVFAAVPFARARGIPIVFWWSHAHVDRRLRAAVRLVDAVVTSSVDSLRVPTPKKHVIGHGIDIDRFRPEPDVATPDRPLRVVSVGRISPVKDIETIVRSAETIRATLGRPFVLELVGGTFNERERDYRKRLDALVRERNLSDVVRFLPEVPHSQLMQVLRGADVFVNALEAGGVGRAWLEAMAAGVPAVLCTTALDHELPRALLDQILFTPGDAGDLGRKVVALLSRPSAEREALGQTLRAYVVETHGLESMIDRLAGVMRAQIDARKARA